MIGRDLETTSVSTCSGQLPLDPWPETLNKLNLVELGGSLVESEVGNNVLDILGLDHVVDFLTEASKVVAQVVFLRVFAHLFDLCERLLVGMSDVVRQVPVVLQFRKDSFDAGTHGLAHVRRL